VVALPCEASWELEDLWLCVCMAPLRLGGIKGKKSTPSIGWEVPVKYQILASGIQTEHQCRGISSSPSSSVTVFLLRIVIVIIFELYIYSV
jgi:hypothetical protein